MDHHSHILETFEEVALELPYLLFKTNQKCVYGDKQMLKNTSFGQFIINNTVEGYNLNCIHR